MRTALVWVAALRVVVGAAAIPLAPFLYREHFVVLVLLRPTKEVLLAGGFLLRSGRVSPLPLFLAALPLLLGGVWLFFGLGRAFGDDLTGDDTPAVLRRLVPAKRVGELCEVLTRRGVPLVFLGRLAAFPSSILAAAAGTSDMRARRFLAADGLGAAASVVEVVGAGLLLGQAHDRAGPWLTVVGVAVLAAGAVLFGRSLRRVRKDGE